MKSEILILEGENGNEKATALINWVENNNLRTHGVLRKIIDGKQHFYNPYMDVTVEAEAAKELKDPDKFYKLDGITYSRKAYKVASSWLRMKPPLNSDYFIIDGIGGLEVESEGLDPELKDVIKAAKNGEMHHLLILGVEPGWRSKVVKKYKLRSARRITVDNLHELLPEKEDESN